MSLLDALCGLLDFTLCNNRFELISWPVLQVFNECKPNGVISPETCEYYQRWLEF